MQQQAAFTVPFALVSMVNVMGVGLLKKIHVPDKEKPQGQHPFKCEVLQSYTKINKKKKKNSNMIVTHIGPPEGGKTASNMI